jgi:Response regulator receiver domain
MFGREVRSKNVQESPTKAKQCAKESSFCDHECEAASGVHQWFQCEPHLMNSAKRNPNGKKIHVLLADDHLVVQIGLRASLDIHPRVEVIGEAGTGQQTLVLVADRQPDVVLLNMQMPDLDGLEVCRRIKLAILSRGSSLTHSRSADGSRKATTHHPSAPRFTPRITHCHRSGFRTIPASFLRHENTGCLLGEERLRRASVSNGTHENSTIWEAGAGMA